jgi:mono/diheme cytochrome c family protein
MRDLRARLPILVGSALLAGTASAADLPHAALAGSASYKVNCAMCHGADARGDGPLTDRLSVRPPDLTLLARRNGGHYPADQVHRIIDGREPVKGHGGPDMPVWGDVFKPGVGFTEEDLRRRIDVLVEYLRTLQAPPE